LTKNQEIFQKMLDNVLSIDAEKINKIYQSLSDKDKLDMYLMKLKFAQK